MRNVLDKYKVLPSRLYPAHHPPPLNSCTTILVIGFHLKSRGELAQALLLGFVGLLKYSRLASPSTLGLARIKQRILPSSASSCLNDE